IRICRSAIPCRRIGSAKGFVGKGLPTYVLPSLHESVHRDGKRSKPSRPDLRRNCNHEAAA
ncbi:hypothetical protein, partial [Methylocaldum sp. RMAD-M]|uniref:hypothetical protein n=1 Tax=Methylocaldum sp. RMAD-M TaxID=2806557 RepID=UPI001AEAC2CB